MFPSLVYTWLEHLVRPPLGVDPDVNLLAWHDLWVGIDSRPGEVLLANGLVRLL